MADIVHVVPRIRTLIEIAGALLRVMSEETAALRSFQIARVGELGPEKQRLVEAYTEAARGFRKDPETLAALTGALREELKEAMRRFDDVAEENQRAIVAAREANERVLRAIVEAAESQRPRASGYSRGGALAASGRRGAAALSVAVDRNL